MAAEANVIAVANVTAAANVAAADVAAATKVAAATDVAAATEANVAEAAEVAAADRHQQLWPLLCWHLLLDEASEGDVAAADVTSVICSIFFRCISV